MEAANSEENIWVYRKSFIESQELMKSAASSPVKAEPPQNTMAADQQCCQEIHSQLMDNNTSGSSTHLNNWDSKLHNGHSISGEYLPRLSCSLDGEKPANFQSKQSLLSHHEGSVISCHHISYKVEQRVGKCCCGHSQQKHILKNISALFKPGMNAIMGPTGSGKTSLIDVLASRKDPAGLMGAMLLDGATPPANFKCMSAYVTQDDIVMGMLTVRENIAFSAALRLPPVVSAEKRSQKVEEVIEELGLTSCADSKVGTEFVRGVSGGERKRTNIAMELITSPSVIFLDEPTTGLDSSMAYSVMSSLQQLSRRGRTVIFSIHQPRFSIFKLFDNLLLLSQGEVVYQGPAQHALPYFSSVGFECEEHNNPCDFFLDVLTGDVPESSDKLQTSTCSSKQNGDLIQAENGSGMIVLDIVESYLASRHKHLVECFVESEWYTRLKSDLKPYEDSLGSSYQVRTKALSYPTSFFNQLRVVSSRTFSNIVRNPQALSTQLCAAVLLGLIVGTIYYQIDSSYSSGIQNRVGAFFFIVMNYVFGNMAAVDTFIKDRHIFIHENVSGYYRVSAYFLSKLLCEIIPMRMPAIVIFACIAYWMIGLEMQLVAFLFFSLNVLLTSLAGTSVALCLSASVRSHTVGTLLTALVWTFMMVFSGLLVNLQSIAKALQWVKWVSIFRYSMNAFLINELKDKQLCDTSVNSLNSTAVSFKCDSGNAYMDRQGIVYETTWDLWQNEVALAVIAFIFYLLAYIQLRRIKKLR